MHPKLGPLDPYHSALHAVDEALRNLVAVGGNLDRTAILDNFCWGNCNKPDRMGAFVQAAKACYDASIAYGTPFVSGKDSLNNEFQTDAGETIAIPPTLLISAISVIDDVSRCVTSDAKEPGNALFIVGVTRPEMGGSHFLLAEGAESGNDVPPVDPAACKATMLAVQRAIEAGLVRSCHDLSEGGLAVGLAEMAFAGGLGVDVSLHEVPVDDDAFAAGDPCPKKMVPKLFGESAGRFVVEVAPDCVDAFAQAVADIPAGRLGEVTDTGRVVIRTGEGPVIDVDIDQARDAWQGTFAGE
jgi:phosphoribosylformylglycinamidine synthase